MPQKTLWLEKEAIVQPTTLHSHATHLALLSVNPVEGVAGLGHPTRWIPHEPRNQWPNASDLLQQHAVLLRNRRPTPRAILSARIAV